MPSTHTESRLSTDARALTERQLDQRVLQIRGELVMLDRDLDVWPRRSRRWTRSFASCSRWFRSSLFP